MFLITEEPIDVCAVLSKSVRPENGAVATFLGTVRDRSNGQAVRELFYETYAPMALKSFETIGREARDRWKVSELSIVHRVGMLSPGEAAVFVLASSEHRKDALSACAYVIERVKEISPVWKKEFLIDRQGVWRENCCGVHHNEHANV